MAKGPMNNKELIQRFFKLQEERVKVYQVFDSGFKEYLQTAPAYDFPKYRQLVYNVTQTFNNLSAEVIDIESKLRESGQHSISNLVRKIQLKEKEKLEMVSLRKLVEDIVELLDELKFEAEDILLLPDT
ncbi:Required for excision 1-B domain-containing protein [Acropora cervicornis]|uniref:Required for excision 1-B domain-containing protein n=1 Tax=Acropora cervicornis TaxID=6130 RepID=A0AAD9VDA9_ACRCE|nr:Required for excision 1-B domain-containing protein [Acropora cervicornis]